MNIHLWRLEPKTGELAEGCLATTSSRDRYIPTALAVRRNVSASKIGGGITTFRVTGFLRLESPWNDKINERLRRNELKLPYILSRAYLGWKCPARMRDSEVRRKEDLRIDWSRVLFEPDNSPETQIIAVSGPHRPFKVSSADTQLENRPMDVEEVDLSAGEQTALYSYAPEVYVLYELRDGPLGIESSDGKKWVVWIDNTNSPRISSFVNSNAA